MHTVKVTTGKKGQEDYKGTITEISSGDFSCPEEGISILKQKLDSSILVDTSERCNVSVMLLFHLLATKDLKRT